MQTIDLLCYSKTDMILLTLLEVIDEQMQRGRRMVENARKVKEGENLVRPLVIALGIHQRKNLIYFNSSLHILHYDFLYEHDLNCMIWCMYPFTTCKLWMSKISYDYNLTSKAYAN